jgi:MoaA/NifB/PqqE/SkfB family radical SAM enzyme
MIALEIIEKCNFRCKYCLPNGVANEKFMPLSLAKRIIKEASDLGITSIDLTPQKGEFFLHPNSYEILDLACSLMKKVELFTNLSEVDINRLTENNLQNLNLHVSHYGDEAKTFVYFTNTSTEMFENYQAKRKELISKNVNVTIEKRDSDIFYNYNIKSNTTGKCVSHYTPTILADGRVMFCNNINNNGIENDLSFDNILDKSLKLVLENPLRYKFYESQDFCKTKCGYFDNNTSSNHPTFVSLKLLQSAKRNYNASI